MLPRRLGRPGIYRDTVFSERMKPSFRRLSVEPRCAPTVLRHRSDQTANLNVDARPARVPATPGVRPVSAEWTLGAVMKARIVQIGLLRRDETLRGSRKGISHRKTRGGRSRHLPRPPARLWARRGRAASPNFVPEAELRVVGIDVGDGRPKSLIQEDTAFRRVASWSVSLSFHG